MTVQEGERPAWLHVGDARETQPDERLQTDGRQDHPFLMLAGLEDDLLITFVTGTTTPPESEQPYELWVSRERLREILPVLTRYAESGRWPQVSEIEIGSTLPNYKEGRQP